jgi:membrane-associated PAP2 superfamily phosphatase
MRRDDGAILGSSPPPEREWLPEGALLVLSALAVTLLFGVSSLDITAARWFYRPTGTDHWPLAAQAPWPLLYRASPWVTASLVIAGLAMLAAGTLLRRRPWRRHAVFVLLSVVLGPGLLGNVLLKDHWNHPRPREIVEFGGALGYVPTPLPGREGGASFPCGHCTVGFLYGIGWWIWKRRRARALTSLSAGLLAGGLLGVGRMAAGAHFLSDILWSALLAAGVSHILYYHVLRLPRDEAPDAAPLAARRPESRWLRASTVAAVLGSAGVLVALFATPHGTPLDTVVPLPSLPQAPWVLEVHPAEGHAGFSAGPVHDAAVAPVRGSLAIRPPRGGLAARLVRPFARSCAERAGRRYAPPDASTLSAPRASWGGMMETFEEACG